MFGHSALLPVMTKFITGFLKVKYFLYIDLSENWRSEGVALYGGYVNTECQILVDCKEPRHSWSYSPALTIHHWLKQNLVQLTKLPSKFHLDSTFPKWRCIIWWMISMFWMIFVPSKTAWSSRWRHYNPLQCCEPLNQHCVKSQELNPQQHGYKKMTS
jgi:hypothetical protein